MNKPERFDPTTSETFVLPAGQYRVAIRHGFVELQHVRHGIGHHVATIAAASMTVKPASGLRDAVHHAMRKFGH